jgi:hypothetical protein
MYVLLETAGVEGLDQGLGESDRDQLSGCVPYLRVVKMNG